MSSFKCKYYDFINIPCYKIKCSSDTFKLALLDYINEIFFGIQYSISISLTQY